MHPYVDALTGPLLAQFWAVMTTATGLAITIYSAIRNGAHVSTKGFAAFTLASLFVAVFLALSNEHERAERLSGNIETLTREKIDLIGQIRTRDARLDDLKSKLESPTAPPPPILPSIEGLRYTTRPIPSPNDQSPYAVEVTVQSAATMRVAFIVFTDGDLDGGDFSIPGQIQYIGVGTGVGRGQYAISFQSPPLTPQAPLIIRIYSHRPFKVLGLKRQSG